MCPSRHPVPRHPSTERETASCPPEMAQLDGLSEDNALSPSFCGGDAWNFPGEDPTLTITKRETGGYCSVNGMAQRNYPAG